MFVVKRPFRNCGIVLTAGSVITEPASIKHFKTRLGMGKIVCVTEDNFKKYQSYFKEKFGVDITPAKATKEDKSDNKENSTKSTVAKAKAKVTVK